MIEESMWDEKIQFIVDGSVTTWDGRVVHFRALVQRRWGWPKKAAFLAADWMLKMARKSAHKAVLHVAAEGRSAQQELLFENIQGLREALCEGLSQRAHKDVYHAGDDVESVMIRFPRPISDDGLVRNILHGVATRLGCTIDDLRAHWCPSCNRHIEPDNADVSSSCAFCGNAAQWITRFANKKKNVEIEILANLFEK